MTRACPPPAAFSTPFLLGHFHCPSCLNTQASAPGRPGLSFVFQHLLCDLGNFFNLSEPQFAYLCKRENNSSYLVDLGGHKERTHVQQSAQSKHPQLLGIRIISFLTWFLASSFETPANFPWLLTASLLSTFEPELILYWCFSIIDKNTLQSSYFRSCCTYISLDRLGSQLLSVTKVAD